MRFRKKNSDVIKDANPCGRNAASRSLHRTLIQQQHILNVLCAENPVDGTFRTHGAGQFQFVAQSRVQGIGN